MSRLGTLIRALGTIGHPPAQDQEYGQSGRLEGESGSRSIDSQSRRNTPISNNSPAASDTPGNSRCQEERLMTQDPSVLADEMTPRPRQRVGYSVREIANQYGVSEPFVR